MIPDPAENIPAHCLRNSCRLKNGSKGYAPGRAVHFHAFTAGMQNQAKNAETIALGARWFVVHTLSPVGMVIINPCGFVVIKTALFHQGGKSLIFRDVIAP